MNNPSAGHARQPFPSLPADIPLSARSASSGSEHLILGKRTVPSWDLRTAPLEFVREKYKDRPPVGKAA